MAVDTTNHIVYALVTSPGESVIAIDGPTGKIIGSVNLPQPALSPYAIAVNSNTHQVFVPSGASSLSVLTSASSTAPPTLFSTVALGGFSNELDVNQNTGAVYATTSTPDAGFLNGVTLITGT